MRPPMAALALLVASDVPASAADRPANEQKAINAVRRLGGDVTTDDAAPGKPVAGVDLSLSTATDADLACLKAFPELHTLDLGDTNVTDAGLKHLAALKDLKTLGLPDSGGVTNAGVAELQRASPECYIIRH